MVSPVQLGMSYNAPTWKKKQSPRDCAAWRGLLPWRSGALTAGSIHAAHCAWDACPHPGSQVPGSAPP